MKQGTPISLYRILVLSNLKNKETNFFECIYVIKSKKETEKNSLC